MILSLHQPSVFVLGTHTDKDTDYLQVAEKAGDYHLFREGLGLKGDEVAFESSRPLSQGSTSKLPVYMALNMEDQVAFINMLGKLKLEVTNTGPVMEGHAPEHMTYWGISAIDMLAKLKQQDLEVSRTVRETGFIDRKTVEQQQIVLSYGEEKLAEITHEEGCGRLTGDALGIIKAAGKDSELKNVLDCAIKMKGGAYSAEIRALVNDEPVELPSYEERKNKVLADKPNSHALNRDLYRYYEKAALQDFMADTKEKVMAGMVKIMEDAGLRAVKIANIAKTNPDFKTELLPERKPAAQKMTMDKQVDVAPEKDKQQEQKDLLKAAVKEAQTKKLSPKESLLQGMENANGQMRQRELQNSI